MKRDKQQPQIPSWLEQVGQKLDQQAGNDPDGQLSPQELASLWAGIEARLDAHKGAKTSPKLFLSLRLKKVMSYAAGVAVLLGISLSVYLFTRPSTNPSERTLLAKQETPIAPIQTNPANQNSSKLPKQSEPITKGKIEEIVATTPKEASISKPPLLATTEAFVGEEVAPDFATIPLDITPSEEIYAFSSDVDNIGVNSESEQIDLVTVEEPSVASAKQTFVEEALALIDDGYNRKAPNHLTLATVGNLFSPHSTEPLVAGSPQFRPHSSRATASSLAMRGNESELLYKHATFKHSIPISVGVRASYQLSPHLALESGVRYTLLHSTISEYYPDRRISQQIHYLGIPLAVNISIYRYKRLELYGGMELGVDKAISTIFDKKRISENPWQFSVGAKGGISISIIPELSVYFSPGISYYFKNNSYLRTYYKEHPFNVSFSMGLRFLPFARW